MPIIGNKVLDISFNSWVVDMPPNLNIHRGWQGVAQMPNLRDFASRALRVSLFGGEIKLLFQYCCKHFFDEKCYINNLPKK